jgi:hypothetical protein
MAVLNFCAAFFSSRNDQYVLISIASALELKLVVTVQRRQLWVVTLSQKYPAHSAANQSIYGSICPPMKTEKPSTSIATSNGSRPSTAFPPSLR